MNRVLMFLQILKPQDFRMSRRARLAYKPVGVSYERPKWVKEEFRVLSDFLMGPDWWEARRFSRVKSAEQEY